MLGHNNQGQEEPSMVARCFIRSCVYALPGSQLVSSCQMCGESLLHTLGCKLPCPRLQDIARTHFGTWTNEEDWVACFRKLIDSSLYIELNIRPSP